MIFFLRNIDVDDLTRLFLVGKRSQSSRSIKWDCLRVSRTIPWVISRKAWKWRCIHVRMSVKHAAGGWQSSKWSKVNSSLLNISDGTTVTRKLSQVIVCDPKTQIPQSRTKLFTNSRFRSKKICMSSKFLFYFTVKTSNLQLFKNFSSKIEGVHKEFQKFVNAEICRYVPERMVLLLISRSEHLAKRAGMMQEMHFRNLSQKVKFHWFFYQNFMQKHLYSGTVGHAIETNWRSSAYSWVNKTA